MRFAGRSCLQPLLSHPASAPVRRTWECSPARHDADVSPSQGRGRPTPRVVPRPAVPAHRLEKRSRLSTAGCCRCPAPAIDRGIVLIVNGKISAVGASVVVPAGARVIDAAGKVVTPGWLDSATQIGIVEIPSSAEGTADQNDERSRAECGVQRRRLVQRRYDVDPGDAGRRDHACGRDAGRQRHVLIGQGAVMDLSGAQAPAAISEDAGGNGCPAWRGWRGGGRRIPIVRDAAVA